MTKSNVKCFPQTYTPHLCGQCEGEFFVLLETMKGLIATCINCNIGVSKLGCAGELFGKCEHIKDDMLE